jgi:2'-5' RNA ligase
MRLFLAIQPAEEIREKIASVYDSLDILKRNFKKISTDNYHITVQFLGEIDNEKVETLQIALHTFCKTRPSFKLVTNHIKYGIGGKAYLEVIPTQDLISLRAQIQNILQSLNITYRQEDFIPHISLTHNSPIFTKEDKELINTWLNNAHLTIEFTVSSLELILSERTNTGANYSVISTFNFS